MDCSNDQQQDFKHFCRICNKGFMCGRALGGHMRAHGVGDEMENFDDEDLVTDLDGNKKMYDLRTNYNRFSRICENCGKEFLSWNSFLEHGKYCSDDAESSLVWSPESEADDDEYGYGHNYGGVSGWSKRKRSSRVCSNEDKQDIVLAKCLMALSNANAKVDHPMEILDDRQCDTTNKEEQTQNKPLLSMEFLSNLTRPPPPLDKAKGVVSTTTPKGMFSCKACKKVFSSHQALGGHRASHKNVKGCFAARNDQFDDNSAYEDVNTHENYKPNVTYQSELGPSTGQVQLAGRKSKVHKCSICSRVFASGQALGGHKRCHWLISNYTTDTSIARFNLHEHIEQLHQRALAIIPRELELNLKLPTSRVDTTKTQGDMQTTPPLDVSTEMNLHAHTTTHQEIGGVVAKEDHYKHQDGNNTTIENMENEESKVKLAKLSELKDLNNTNGVSSSWLQVGIGSTADVAHDP
ncbi:Zinc finger, C2H2 [Artemisia annua]|uniref:Zinc finger, C2H2 n=1 Tax=Artemisia annua TaxID=35608 RepID=A0A2U1P3Y6_ARTAN|nr:Zinc finger, C2H2 [Artemisia annua]